MTPGTQTHRHTDTQTNRHAACSMQPSFPVPHRKWQLLSGQLLSDPVLISRNTQLVARSTHLATRSPRNSQSSQLAPRNSKLATLNSQLTARTVQLARRNSYWSKFAAQAYINWRPQSTWLTNSHRRGHAVSLTSNVDGVNNVYISV